MPSVLIAEDEWLVAQDLAEEVKAAGCNVIGPAHSVSAALALLEKSAADGALLDVNLRRETSYPVAEHLTMLGVPFAFLSGYAANQLRPDFSTMPLLSKPISVHALRTCLAQMMERK